MGRGITCVSIIKKMGASMKAKRILTETDEQRTRRLRNWDHTRMIGHAKLMQTNAHKITGSETANWVAKHLAERIATLSEQLAKELRFRVDHPLEAG